MRKRKDETADEAVAHLMAEAAKKAAPKLRKAYEMAVQENDHTGSVLDLMEDVFQRELAEHFGPEWTQRRKPFAA